MILKKILYLLAVILVFTACKTSSLIASSKKGKTSRYEDKKIEKLAEKLVDLASNNIGVKYKYGGTTRAGFDCSGLVYTVFNSENIVLPRNSFEQSKIGVVLNHKRDQVKIGDLLFFKTDNSKKINHVGIVTEVNGDEIEFIHSSTSKGVIISSTKQAYYRNSLVQINRIL
ncbi:lipoprotein Spr [Flavobacterium sp. PL11]|uniref:C40 family peptidase n=1 Tax=Flavobacterium sp. PL11 TaxID=3071717 RepID=UPI002DFCE3CC|nr:lipoprotein Spr [Flavobacterium sp. PL11]